jgi:FAD/FMN-containing dehydrogenase
MIQTRMTHEILRKLNHELYLCGEDVSARFSRDWSGDRECMPPVVLRPGSTEDVSQMLALCQAHGQGVVTQGGLTSLSGGAVPLPGEWALSLERLSGIVELDRQSMTITVKAGTPLQLVQEAAIEAGLVFPLDMGSRGSCTAGGITATNAGGNQVIQHGMTRALVLGLEVVLADGRIISNRNKLLKNNAGFDLKQLFIGSEGTLGVITEVTFRLFPQKQGIQTALCAARDFDGVIDLLQQAGRRLSTIKAFEVMWAEYFHDACVATRIASPFTGRFPCYVLLETDGADDDISREIFENTLTDCLEKGLVEDVVVAQNLSETKRFWRIRDGVSELVPLKGPFAHLDIGVPVSAMRSFAEDADRLLRQAFEDCVLYIFGHVGDSNLHVLVSVATDELREQAYEIIYGLTGKFGGSITAEHGVGTNKKNWLHLSRNQQEIELMKQLKRTLDPAGILNRHRVFDWEGQTTPRNKSQVTN